MTPTLAPSKAPSTARRARLFPSAELVAAAAGQFAGERVPERTLGCTLVPERSRVSEATSRRLFPEQYADRSTGLLLPESRAAAPRVGSQIDREMVEGPAWRITVSPGSISLRYRDEARAERAAERAVDAMIARREQGLDDLPGHGACVTSWSAKSRSRMVETIAQLDIAAVLPEGSEACVVTLTYPGEWLAVAPDSLACRAHVDAFRKRYRRRWGVPLVGIWKREFQRRGAPHYHIWTVPPAGVDRGEFRRWIGDTWASVVGHPDPVQRERHRVAGTACDWSTGRRSSDPYALGVYFSKHGSFAAKDYQNVAPREWVETGSVGRFWGYWGLRKATAGVIVHPVDALNAGRVLRRHSRANSYVAAVPAWKYRTMVDVDTGEVTAKWRKGVRRQRVYRMRHGSGYVVNRHAVSLAAQLARFLDQTAEPRPPERRSGSGPVGFLP